MKAMMMMMCFVRCLRVGGAFVTNRDALPETAARAHALIG